MAKKTLKGFILFGLIFIFYASITSPTRGEAQVLDNFHPKVLPTNPFYAIKNLKRGFNRLLTLGSRGRLELGLRISEEKAQEIEAILKFQKKDLINPEKYLGFYNEGLEKLQRDFVLFKEKNKKSIYEDLLNSVFNSIVAQSRFFENLSVEFREFRVEFEKTKEKLTGFMILIANLDKNIFEEKLSKLAEEANDFDSQFRFLNFLVGLENRPNFPGLEKAIILKSDLIGMFEGSLLVLSESEREKYLNDLKLVTPENILAFESVREVLVDPDLKSLFNSFRKTNIDLKEAETFFEEEETKKTIEFAEDIILALEKEENPEGSIPKETKRRFLEQAQINLDQAQKFLGEARFGPALFQAGSARAVALNGLSHIFENKNKEEAIRLLRIEFDQLKSKSNALNQNERDGLGLPPLFSEAEKYLVVPKSIEDLRKAKVILGKLRGLLLNY